MSSKRRISICRCLTPISDSHAPLSHGISLMFDALGFHRHSCRFWQLLTSRFHSSLKSYPSLARYNGFTFAILTAADLTSDRRVIILLRPFYITLTMSHPSSSYADISHPGDEPVDDLPSSSAGSTTSVSPSEEEALSDAEREWRESLQQLELLLTMVLVPYLGKYFGRKCAYWGTKGC
jgi:hypothetical protein